MNKSLELKRKRKFLTMLGMTLSLSVTGCANGDVTKELNDANKKIQHLEYQIEQSEKQMESLSEEKESLALENQNLTESKVKAEEKLRDYKEKFVLVEENEFYRKDLKLLVTRDNEYPRYFFIASENRYDEDSKLLDDSIKAEVDHTKYRYITNQEETFETTSVRFTSLDKDGRLSYFDYYDDMTGYTSFEKKYFVPDVVNVNLIIEGNKIPFPEKYKDRKVFTYDDLKEIENLLNSPDYDMFDAIKNTNFNVSDLIIVEKNNFFFIVSKRLNIIKCMWRGNYDKIYTYNYMYDITDPTVALLKESKTSTREDYFALEQGVFKEEFEYSITSTDIGKLITLFQDDVSEIKIHEDITPFLPESLQGKLKLSYQDIVELQNILINSRDSMKLNRQMN